MVRFIGGGSGNKARSEFKKLEAELKIFLVGVNQKKRIQNRSD